MFAMGIYLLHEATHGEMNKSRARFFWEGAGNKRKYHMVDWATVCKPKELGGLGILNTKLMNIALMLKWIWKLYQGAEGLWVDLLQAKFRRTFGTTEVVEWENLCRIFDLHPFSEGEDEVSWALEPSGIFSTRSIYGRMSQGAAVTHFREVWKTRVPPRIRVFSWQLIGASSRRECRLLRGTDQRQWACAFGEEEDCNHIFFSCHLANRHGPELGSSCNVIGTQQGLGNSSR
ncbi:hypothetical protein QYE76_012898 [Lolium multiflorum]|uniref:Reverse transcriptase zinc-binding domain-containing protein n=1 Tax=Lolium multiflorum TaxID=4521 RepID=A0AAD8TXY1_LOLMU|nr:hypothetical protein QYE76_012898 [Lolium multiflorum]